MVRLGLLSGLILLLWLRRSTSQTTFTFEAPGVNFILPATLALTTLFFSILLSTEANRVYLVDSSSVKTQYISIQTS